MEQMTATVKQNANNTAQANQLADSVREQASAAASMPAIEQSGRPINASVGPIDEIASQINLLASMPR